jgi:hypothetical protein
MRRLVNAAFPTMACVNVFRTFEVVRGNTACMPVPDATATLPPVAYFS